MYTRAELHYRSHKVGKNKKKAYRAFKNARYAFLQARTNALHSTCNFLALGLIFGILPRVKEINDYKARADWLR